MQTALADTWNNTATRQAATLGMPVEDPAPKWYALSTLPRSEKSVAKHLESTGFAVFLPTYTTTRIWKNRQRVTLTLPLFTGYVFVRTAPKDRFRALRAVGAGRFVSNSAGPLSIPHDEIEGMRDRCATNLFVPFDQLVVGERVRILRGPLEGIVGTLARIDNEFRFVVSVDLINQHIAAIVDPGNLQPVQ